MLRSEHILKGLGNQYYRATYKSMGFTTEDLKRPLIGIANAWSECVPGHYNLRQVAQRVKDGIYRAGGTPIEFGVIGGCDGMGQGHDGMHFIMALARADRQFHRVHGADQPGSTASSCSARATRSFRAC